MIQYYGCIKTGVLEDLKCFYIIKALSPFNDIKNQNTVVHDLITDHDWES